MNVTVYNGRGRGRGVLSLVLVSILVYLDGTKTSALPPFQYISPLSLNLIFINSTASSTINLITTGVLGFWGWISSSKDEPIGPKRMPNKELAVGQTLPRILQNKFPTELIGKPIEEID